MRGKGRRGRNNKGLYTGHILCAYGVWSRYRIVFHWRNWDFMAAKAMYCSFIHRAIMPANSCSHFFSVTKSILLSNVANAKCNAVPCVNLLQLIKRNI